MSSCRVGRVMVSDRVHDPRVVQFDGAVEQENKIVTNKVAVSERGITHSDCQTKLLRITAES